MFVGVTDVVDVCMLTGCVTCLFRMLELVKASTMLSTSLYEMALMMSHMNRYFDRWDAFHVCNVKTT